MPTLVSWNASCNEVIHSDSLAQFKPNWSRRDEVVDAWCHWWSVQVSLSPTCAPQLAVLQYLVIPTTSLILSLTLHLVMHSYLCRWYSERTLIQRFQPSHWPPSVSATRIVAANTVTSSPPCFQHELCNVSLDQTAVTSPDFGASDGTFWVNFACLL